MRLALLALLLTGCALPLHVTKGQVAPGMDLVTYRVVSEADAARECGPPSVDLAGCARVQWVVLPGGTTVTGLARITVISQEPALVAHELCHIVATFNRRAGALDRDPCHDEDRGVPIVRRRPR